VGAPSVTGVLIDDLVSLLLAALVFAVLFLVLTGLDALT
jgi:hypothetical protein